MLTSIFRILLTRSSKPFVFKGIYSNELRFKELEKLGLYVHIPFCRAKCSFCPYCKEIFDVQASKEYKQALLKEIDIVCKNMTQKKQVTTLYFGGGTPALMLEDLNDIIQKLKEYFDIYDGIGIELHPEDLKAETLSRLRAIGITMVSIGVQTFDNECLSKLGRKSSDIKQGISLVKQHGFEVIDIDLIFGIPGQNKEILKNDIESAFELGATQVSTYPFIDFTFANNKHKPLTHKEKNRMLKYLNDICNEMCIERTAVWTFAKKDTKKYSSVTRDTFLGFGVSATTLLENIFKINTFSIKAYIERVNKQNLPTALTLDFTPRQRAVYYLFWGAYSLRINKQSFKSKIYKDIKSMYRFELFIAKALGFIREDDNDIVLTDRAAHIYHYLEQKYTTAYIDKMWNISMKEPFPNKILLK